MSGFQPVGLLRHSSGIARNYPVLVGQLGSILETPNTDTTSVDTTTSLPVTQSQQWHTTRQPFRLIRTLDAIGLIWPAPTRSSATRLIRPKRSSMRSGSILRLLMSRGKRPIT